MKLLIFLLTLFILLTGNSFAASSSNEEDSYILIEDRPLIVAGLGDFLNLIQKEINKVLNSTTKRVMGEMNVNSSLSPVAIRCKEPRTGSTISPDCINSPRGRMKKRQLDNCY